LENTKVSKSAKIVSKSAIITAQDMGRDSFWGEIANFAED
jgi:hypothetical protein